MWEFCELGIFCGLGKFCEFGKLSELDKACTVRSSTGYGGEGAAF